MTFNGKRLNRFQSTNSVYWKCGEHDADDIDGGQAKEFE